MTGKPANQPEFRYDGVKNAFVNNKTGQTFPIPVNLAFDEKKNAFFDKATEELFPLPENLAKQYLSAQKDPAVIEGRHQAALEIGKAFESARTSALAAAILQARQYLEEGHFAKAKKILEEIFREYPYDSEARDLLEFLPLKMKKALEKIRHFAWLDPVAAAKAAALETAQKLAEKHQTRSRKAADLPQVENIYISIVVARMYLNRGLVDEARRVLKELLKLHPGDVEATALLKSLPEEK
jgi:tetratricopeptide (TPR) repeat protein